MYVAHVKTHRTKKEKEKMTKIERFVTEGNEKAMSWQKQEQCWTKALWQVKQVREEVHVALQYAASFHCLVEEWKIVRNSGQSRKKSGVLLTREGRE